MRNRHFFLVDLALLPAVAALSFALRLNTTEVQNYGPHILLLIVLALPVKLLVFRWFGLYSRYWRYASIDELALIGTAVGVSSAVAAGLLFGLALPLTHVTGFPRSIPFIDGLLTLLAVGGPRFAIRLAEQHRQRERRRRRQGPERRVLVMGAGDAGAMIVKEMRANPQLGLVPVGFLDDDKYKRGVQIHGVPVLGTREQIPELAQEYRVTEVIIAMPTAPGSVIREILDICNQAGVPARTIPGMYSILSGQVSVSQIREVDIEDLLRREPVEIDTAAVQALIRGKRVLVTGGGGSIGSELCRQIVRAGAGQLVLLGHGENSVFEIHNELRRLEVGGWKLDDGGWKLEVGSWKLDDGVDSQPPTSCPTGIQPPISNLQPPISIHAVIADIRDRGRLEQVFGRYRPELVFHAAAHKHVPLMEANVCEAVTNNILGTRNLVQVAGENGVGHFVLISTDKAVNPTSVMGCSKRVAELMVYDAARRHGRCFAAVRFGNVLGSRGSVVNIFRRQIAQGGPVKVTHPEMRRYFMTIPEAVQLVLQAAALGQGGEVFVLDMGEPVRIVDLATDLIRLSGLQARVAGGDYSPRSEVEWEWREAGSEGDWDIEVVFTGVRPGEKLFEELFVEGEGYGRTRHEKIFVAMNGGNSELRIANGELGIPTSNFQLPTSSLDEQVDRLIELARAGDEVGVRRMLGEIVPEYQGAGEREG